MKALDIMLAVGWLVVALCDLLLQQPVSWFASMFVCLGLAVAHTRLALNALE